MKLQDQKWETNILNDRTNKVFGNSIVDNFDFSYWSNKYTGERTDEDPFKHNLALEMKNKVISDSRLKIHPMVKQWLSKAKPFHFSGSSEEDEKQQ